MRSLAEELIDYIRYKQECGEKSIELDAETLALLTATPQATPSSEFGVRSSEVQERSNISAHTASVQKNNSELRTPNSELSPAPPSAPAAPFASKPDIPRPAPLSPTTPNSELRTPNSTKATPNSELRTPNSTKATPNSELQTPNSPAPTGAGPDLLIVGETEAIKAEKYGELLAKMIEAMGYKLNEVVITNICGKPRAEKPPTLAEMQAAMSDFKTKIKEIDPKIILILGSTATLGILGKNDVSSVRGKWFTFEGKPLIATYHPAYLIKFPGAKKDAWHDLQRIMEKLGKKQ